ncbi:MAG: hypothetical protein A3B91_01600 [Candidatus Yanofskybacteria bacterium RIFCSPHIGHO2_02_FULL_41_29]|uniref:Glycosyl transferase family 1 domain-containing protein n=1 Tax=Candidatus Yanofskybacteria bacterium RIFCSPHIGHO2_01_FULL_41_53 TaxID=1802663 RepID=A0A1F8EJ68_9BACT|nr:MAG: hypothetical protein A2650_00830 [Candidatus Yanofskybacteria bacterium RIFCSPHIGHO2_01_FULL_41_53]OGN12078.1 MAG: hypothetical protein A3B91_01600 [Candidatus Yanofskybacteria bacterium RIFCSPHIGHO2_02_FULL_41_29]OGN17804.1 MAG: hypothetical protein A3F48_01915 [Candidatus Yanofskybacteria bacterium RIFCSPHIGHO2_12_FULL_41_9]OGN22347.1 MAG: hypothetical protein A2916_04950 [Candidatus Yanofskybacteria bacterium RIFCSPLOWO2_01_FULL_41_67]OGN30039.1 MAG: hypothetical protein A3H54_02365 
MVIGIDIRVLENRVKSGIEEYTENLLSHMLPLDKSIKYKLFSSGKKDLLYSYDWLLKPNIEVHKFKIPNKLLRTSSFLFDRPQVDKILGGVDVFFSPHFLLAALSPDCKRVTTFHDLSYVHFPEFFSWQRSLWHTIEMKPRWQSKFSDRIIAVSDSTKHDLVSIYGVDPTKVSVIYSGVSPSIKRPTDKELESFRLANKLPSKFILFLGKLEPRKNIVGIIKAFEALKKKYKDLSLVIVGSRGWLDEGIATEALRSTYNESVIFKDYIPDKDRSFFYGLASAFVYPSFFEGFGFPPLEAMVCGTPVVVSHSSSLPEVVRKGGILINPHNISDLCLSISNILDDERFKDKISALGQKLAADFTWDKTATATLDRLIK